MVPNTPGSGYDTTARAAAKVMDEVGATKNVEVFNLAGAGGTVGLSRTVSEKGNGKLLMMMGLGVVGAQYTNKSTSQARPDHPDRQADRGVRRDRGGQELPVQDDQRAGRRPGRPTRRASRWAAARCRAARTTCCRCNWPRPSASTPRRSTSSPTTAAATCCRPCWAARSPSAPPASASSSTRWRPARCGCWRSAGRSGSPRSTPRR